MRPVVALSFTVGAVLCASLASCSSSNSSTGFGDGSSSGGSSSGGSGSSSGGSGSGSGSSSGNLVGDGGTASSSGGGDGGVTTMTTIYANTDDTLYSVDPMSNAVTQIGTFSGTSGTTTDKTVTDVAVNANGDVYVNTESVVYKAAVPTSPGTVTLTKVATIQTTGKFYALAFTPAGSLDPNNEVLIGGDGSGVLWSIDTASGATKQLGSFGNDPSTSGNIFELSGDLVFYTDSSNSPLGLATIRSCASGGGSSTCGADFLASVDMTKLKAAYGGTTQASLLGGIYGGSGTNLGSGTGYHDVFGLGAWNSKVFGFTRHTSTSAPALITIDTTSGAGTMVANNFTFTNGWSGAGVTTKVTVTVPQPPPTPQ